MTPEAWPTPSEGPSREPLPRVEDLPVAEQGYDQESVRAAFDSFYRHAAQLDAALRTLEAVDSFHRQAAALRADLRTLRTAGWTQQPFSPPPLYGYGTHAPREGISPAVWRVLGEVIFLVAVSVVLGVAKLSWWLIVAVMAGAFLIIALIEWAASRDRWAVAPPAPAPAHPVVDAERAPERRDESESVGWAAFEEAQEPSDAMTMIGEPQEPPVGASEPAADAPAAPADEVAVAEPEPVVEAVAAEQHEEEAVAEPDVMEPEVAAQPSDEEQPTPRRRWWRRRASADEAESEQVVQAVDVPRHVRVIAANEQSVPGGVDPWERGFDTDAPAGEAAAATEPDEDTDENEAAVSADSESEPRRRFRRR